ncbi:hypothetical protein DTL42_17360 [Bremerella cremea]|uniref:Tetratricopeptide repeat protein n=1 Tax=Bremerella cremea TaxID=1031537 RepID=A0A368KQI1_9BACT|nr:hypothetical protein [Bremerella cremea]RCS44690.1 hypothetical protein DTL42_17360 [Bremerella cremea]
MALKTLSKFARTLTMGGLLAATLLAPMPSVQAEDADALIGELLKEGWQVGPAGMDVVRRGEASAGQLRDPNVFYATGLALLRHHQYDEAAAAFDAAIQLDRKHYPSWRGLIWVRTLQEKFDNALVFATRLGKELPTSELMPDQEAEVVETIRLMGRLFGFYEGPRSGEVSAALVQRARDAIEPALVGSRQVEFENNYQDVATLFTASTTLQQDAKDDALQQEKLQKMQQQQEIAIRRKQIDIDKQQAAARVDQLRSEWTQEQQKFDQAEAPLNAALGQLDAQQRVIRNELALLVDDIFRLNDELGRTKDPNRRDRLQREIFRLERLVSGYEQDLALVQAEARRLSANRDNLRTRRLQTQQQFEAEIKQQNDRQQDLARAEKRVDLEARRNNRPAVGNTAKVRVLSAKASSIRTYADFPLEVERLTLLGN